MSDDTPHDQDDVTASEGKMPGTGRRQDGKPFKDGNTREDGSYIVGKGKTPTATRFAKDDGRERGKRKKGSKNASSIWAKKLNEKITIEGKTQTAAEWLADRLIRRGIMKSDRAAEIAMSRADLLEGQSERKMSLSDSEIIEGWFAQRLARVAEEISNEDDAGANEPPDKQD